MAETLQAQLLAKFTQIVLQAQAIENFHLDSLKSHVSQTETTFKALDPVKEQEIFVDHNVGQFAPPGDWSFEPCVTHYDTVGARFPLLYVSSDWGISPT